MSHRPFIATYFQVKSSSRFGGVCADGSVSPPNTIRSSAVPRHREEGLRCQEAECDNRGGEGAVHGDEESVPPVPVSGQWLPHCPEEQGAGADHGPQHNTRGR